MKIDSNYVLKKYIARVTLAGMIFLSLTGCRTSTQVDRDRADVTSKPENEAIVAVEQPKPAIENSSKIVPPNGSLPPEPAKKAIVNLYQPDIECKKLIPEPVSVQSDRSMDAAVRKVLQARNTADFTVSGYRISIDKNRVATVDLRLHPDSRRQFISLSTCEQFALFGSLRETLTNYPDWQIKAVQFRDRGKPIQL